MPPPSQTKDEELESIFDSINPETRPQIRFADDLEDYMIQDPVKIDCTPLQWRCKSENRKQCPRLSQMAIDILSIPPESAEPERAFSGARRTASWDRLRMKPQTLEQIECIGNWLREELIVPYAKGGQGPELVELPAISLEDDDGSIDSE